MTAPDPTACIDDLAAAGRPDGPRRTELHPVWTPALPRRECYGGSPHALPEDVWAAELRCGFPLVCYEVADAMVRGLGVAEHAGAPLTGPLLHPHGFFPAAWQLGAAPPAPTRTVDGPCALVTVPEYRIYGHALIDVLPRLLLARRVGGADVRILVPADMPAFYDSFFAFLGMAEDRIVRYDPATEALHCPRLLLPGTCRVSSTVHPFVRTAFHDDFLAPALAAAPGRDWPERILISRRRWVNPSRRLVNWDDVARTCQARGLVEVFPERMSIAEQIALFHHARIVVGEAGSAMHTDVFCASGASVVVLQSYNNTSHVDASMAAIGDFGIGYILGETFSRPRPPGLEHVGDFLIDTDMLSRVLSDILASGAPTNPPP